MPHALEAWRAIAALDPSKTEPIVRTIARWTNDVELTMIGGSIVAAVNENVLPRSAESGLEIEEGGTNTMTTGIDVVVIANGIATIGTTARGMIGEHREIPVTTEIETVVDVIASRL